MLGKATYELDESLTDLIKSISEKYNVKIEWSSNYMHGRINIYVKEGESK